MEVLVILIMAGAMVFASAAIRGYVLSTMWGWFIVPTFGVAEISIPVACGISLVAAMLTADPSADGDSDSGSSGMYVIQLLVGPLFTLLFGRIILAFM